MTLQEINSLQLTDDLSNLLSGRIKDNKLRELYESMPENEHPAQEDMDSIRDGETPQVEIDAEFLIYKEELRDAEIERLRVKDLKDRISGLSDHNAAHNRINPGVSNRNLWTRKNILEEADKMLAEANLLALEVADEGIQGERSSVEYKELRRAEYGSIEDQLDKIFHEGLDAWKVDIQAVKDKHPKP